MICCEKLVDLDATLQKLKNNSAPFGGIDLILAGDFAQLPPVKHDSIFDAMVHSTLVYTKPSEISLATAALIQRFMKFNVTEFNRSKSCKFVSSLLKRFRNFNRKGGSLSVDDLK